MTAECSADFFGITYNHRGEKWLPKKNEMIHTSKQKNF